MRKGIGSIVLIGLLLLAGCKKDGGNTEPDAPGTVTITSPSPIGIYINGTPLKIEGTMSDNNVLALARVEIRKKNTNDLLHTQASNTGNVGFFSFLWNWTITGITGPTPVIVRVFAKDRLGNEVSAEVETTLDI